MAGSWTSTTSDDSNQFDLIPIGQWMLPPFVSMQSKAIVLDQDRLRRQMMTFDQVRNRFSATRINGFAIQ